MKSVNALLNSLGMESKFLDDRKIIKGLMVIRATKHITLREIAAATGITVHDLEIMETSKDSDINPDHLLAYKRAL